MSKKKEVKTNVMRILDKNNITYESLVFNSDIYSSIDEQVKKNNSDSGVFKTLVCTNGKKEYFVFMIPSLKHLDLKKAAKVSHNKTIYMITQKELHPLTGYVHGGCSPIGMKKTFKTYISNKVLNYEKIYYSAGKVSVLVLTSKKGLFEIINPEISNICVDEENL